MERLRGADHRSARAEFSSLYDGPLTVEYVALRLARYEFFFNYERPTLRSPIEPRTSTLSPGGCLVRSHRLLRPYNSSLTPPKRVGTLRSAALCSRAPWLPSRD